MKKFGTKKIFFAVIFCFLFSSAAFAAALPEDYYLGEDGLLRAEVRNQGELGFCWTFSATEALQSGLLKASGKKENIDFSPWGFAYLGYQKGPYGEQAWWYKDDDARIKSGALFKIPDPYEEGKERTYNNGLKGLAGTSEMAIAIMARNNGPLLAKDAPYIVSGNVKDSKGTALVDKKPYMPDYSKLKYKLVNARMIDTEKIDFWKIQAGDAAETAKLEKNKTNIKNAILKYGAVDIAIKWDNEKSDEDSANIFNNSEQTDHKVAIVGWQDFGEDVRPGDFKPIEGKAPKNDGAWIIRNSWGDYNKYAGHVFASYETTSIYLGNMYTYEVKAANDMDKEEAYFYDDLGMIGFEGKATTGSFGNLFRADARGKLRAVSFWTPLENTAYTVSVYKDCNTNAKVPITTGTKVATISGKMEDAGYHRIDLDKVVELKRGDDFSVVVTLKLPKEDYIAAVQYAKKNDSEALEAVEEGICWFKLDNDEWFDGATVNKLEGQVADGCVPCVKAYMLMDDNQDDDDSAGCNAGFGALALLLAIPLFRRKRH